MDSVRFKNGLNSAPLLAKPLTFGDKFGRDYVGSRGKQPPNRLSWRMTTNNVLTDVIAEFGRKYLWSKEMRGRGITVNAVAPGPTATDLFLNGKSPELIDRLAKMNPMERLGTPEDIASAVAFLVGPDGGWINGQVLRANGGMV